MKHYDTDANGRKVDENEANAIADLAEDFPEESPPAEAAPKLTRIEHPGENPGRKKDGVDRAMEILDEYMDGVPPRNPDVPHDEE